LPEEERQKIKDLLFISEKFNVSESAYRELTVFCDGLPRTSGVQGHRTLQAKAQFQPSI
jgi:hypothetical protein